MSTVAVAVAAAAQGGACNLCLIKSPNTPGALVSRAGAQTPRHALLYGVTCRAQGPHPSATGGFDICFHNVFIIILSLSGCHLAPKVTLRQPHLVDADRQKPGDEAHYSKGEQFWISIPSSDSSMDSL